MRNQKGFTLVELLVGMAILSIVAAAITSFIVTSSRSYAAANTEIVVQQESQLAMNQMSDVIIDTTRSVNYVGYSADGSVSQQAVKDADFTIDVEDKSLTLFNGEGTVVLDAYGNPVLDAEGNPEIAKDAEGKPIITGGNGNDRNYQFYWDKSDEILYYSEIALGEETFPAGDRVVLAEYVKDFSVDLSQVEEKRVVQLTISYEYNNRLYETSNNITIRNRVLVNSVNLAIDRTVELSIRPKENMVVLEPGESYHFSTPRVDGRNVLDKSVTWSISTEMPPTDGGDGHTYFTDIANGFIHISSDEMANSFKVTVTTNQADSSGAHASADVLVYVKRAKTVSLSKTDKVGGEPENSALEITAGSTITISAHVEGNKLGVTCSNCGDDTSIDRYVVENENTYKWSLIDSNGICTMDSSGHEAAEFTISSSAKPGQQITIGATSLLSTTSNGSYGRSYASVTGWITLTVASHASKNISVGGPIRYGYSSKIDINVPGFNTAGQGYYIVCARIQSDDPKDKEKIMLYSTNGGDTWLTPDLFGLGDIDKTYNISVQLLDPKGHFHVGDALSTDVVNDYLANCDATGTYVGTKYPASDKISVTLNPPLLTYEYKDAYIEDSSVNIDTIYAAYAAANAGAKTGCTVAGISNARPETMDGIRYDVYQEKDGAWELLYGFDESGNYNRGKSQYGALKFILSNAKNPQIEVDQNNSMTAMGTYRYVPYIKYSHSPTADHGFFVYYKNYEPEYNVTEYYKRENSTIYFTILGGSIELIAYTDNALRKGEAYFPIPSDTGSNGFTKYFNLNDTSVQHSKENPWLKLCMSGGSTSGIQISDMTCQYIASEDSYVIKLFYKCRDSFWQRDVEMSAGTYKCAADGTEWSKIDRGDLDDQFGNSNVTMKPNGNAEIKIKGSDGNTKSVYAYLPLPSDTTFTNQGNENFGFDLDKLKSGEYESQTVTGKNVSIAYRKNSTDNQASYASCTEATCKYDAGTKTYTLKLTYTYNGTNDNTPGEVTLTYKEGDRSWTLQNN